MGNAPSFSLRRRRAHLDESTVYTKPSGLYATCAWDEKYVRKLILREELAPRHPGQDDRSQVEPEECPICMLHYPSLNETKCCAARLCTECYLQIRPPPRHSKEPCPFCKYKKLDAVYRGPRDKRELARELEDERRATDAIRRASSRAPLPVHAGPSGLAASSSYPGPLTPPPPSDSDESEEDATEAGSLVPLDSAYDSTQGGPSRTLRSITSDATVSSAASAAAQAGNSAASASSSSVILENGRVSVDVATTRRFPYPYCGPEFPRMKFCVSADSDVPVIFSQEPENEEYPPSEDADSCAMQLSASSVDCCETVYTLSLNEAIHRSLLEM